MNESEKSLKRELIFKSGLDKTIALMKELSIPTKNGILRDLVNTFLESDCKTVNDFISDKSSGYSDFVLTLQDDLLTDFGIEIRICSECGKIMIAGYCINDGLDYYCSDECLYKNYTKEEYKEMNDNDEGDSYWTDWYELPYDAKSNN